LHLRTTWPATRARNSTDEARPDPTTGPTVWVRKQEYTGPIFRIEASHDQQKGLCPITTSGEYKMKGESERKRKASNRQKAKQMKV
jgi:hypothetical protein